MMIEHNRNNGISTLMELLDAMGMDSRKAGYFHKRETFDKSLSLTRQAGEIIEDLMDYVHTDPERVNREVLEHVLAMLMALVEADNTPLQVRVCLGFIARYVQVTYKYKDIDKELQAMNTANALMDFLIVVVLLGILSKTVPVSLFP